MFGRINEKAPLTVRNLMALLSALSIIFVFCPAISMDSYSVTIFDVNSAMNVISSYASALGQSVNAPTVLLYLCLIAPIVVLVFLFLKKFDDKTNTTIILVSMAVDLLVWIFFASTVNRYMQNLTSELKTTVTYKLNVVSILLIIVCALLLLLEKIAYGTDLTTIFNSNNAKAVMKQASNTANKVSASISNTIPKRDIIGYCYKCGAPIEYGNKFCTSCGTPVSQSMIAEAEDLKKTEAEKKAKKEAEAKAEAERLAQEKVQKEAEEARKQAEEQARLEEIKKAAEKARQEVEAERMAQEKAQKEAEEARRQAEAQAKLEENQKTVVEVVDHNKEVINDEEPVREQSSNEEVAEQTKTQETQEPTVPEPDQVEPVTMNSPKFCRHCGTMLEADSLFCHNCGEKVD